MKSKKGLNNTITTIIIFSLFIFIFLFATVGFKQIFSENIIQPVLDQTLALNKTFTIAPSIQAAQQSVKDSYDLDFFNYDLFFLVIFISMFIGTIFSAQQSKKLGLMSFFGMISVGTWIFLLIISIVTQISDWLVLNLYTNLFDLTSINTPIIDFFLANVSFICFLWFIIILIINQIDFQDVFRRVTESEGREEE
ncbi:MAG: hypothetical protein OEV44_00860 [Spirochaetota bacterium]|nr:hypothetical protein [Spirochaetota bacterium]